MPTSQVSPWAVHKFGGTCLANAERFARAADLAVAAGDARAAVVVSAPGGVTDALIRTLELAAARDDGWQTALEEVRDRVVAIAGELLGQAAAPVVERIVGEVSDVTDVLRGVRVARSFGEPTLELVSGYGELWSARLLHAELAARGLAACWLDAREVLVVEHGSAGPSVDWELSGTRMRQWRATHDQPLVVITGYIASDRAGVPTTLKRNGSDFSASIFARLLEATSITIWTDVDGVLSADPRCVPEAVLLDEMSYDEAMELAYFGAKVLHPHTMGPAVAGGIPIRIRNALRPNAPGTLLHAGKRVGGATSRSAVKGFSSTNGVALLNVEGAGMIGVPGVASRLFGALRDVGVSVIMVSQASSEHSICVAVRQSDAARAEAAVRRAFTAELLHGQVRTVDVSGPYSVLAAVGDRMVETPGVAARFFAALGNAGINVRAIAQGSSERNISAVVAERDNVRALRALHAGFYLSDQTLSIGLIGPGLVGGELLRQIGVQAEVLRARFHIDLRVRAVATSTQMVLDDLGLEPTHWQAALAERGEALDLDRFVAHARGGSFPHAVIVDCTASAAVAARYADWLGAGLHVVTPNKKANSAAWPLYEHLRALAERGRVHYLYEATVGAGLPVIQTLRDLLRSGDRVRRIEGVLSGTLSFLFNALRTDRPFSALVREARRLGFTEPDPREDLEGVDVARKAVILARETGVPLELDAVAVQSLVPAPLRHAPDATAFLDGLRAHDADFETLRADAAASGEVLRYVATIEATGADGDAGGRTTVGVRRYGADHAFARLVGGDNIIAFTTDRYCEQPLIVQGPGAGPAVTAAGVFADLLRVVASIGTRA